MSKKTKIILRYPKYQNIIDQYLSLDEFEEKAVETMIGVLPLAMLLDAGILAPFVEENVFRKTFKNAFPNKYLFIFLSAFVFGLIHVITSATSPLDYLYKTYKEQGSLNICNAKANAKKSIYHVSATLLFLVTTHLVN